MLSKIKYFMINKQLKNNTFTNKVNKVYGGTQNNETK